MAVVIEPLAQDPLVLMVRFSADRSDQDSLASVCATLIDELDTESGRARALVLCVDGAAPDGQSDLLAVKRCRGAAAEDRFLALRAEADALHALTQLDVQTVALFDRAPGAAEMALALHFDRRAVRAGATVRLSLGLAHPADLPGCGTWYRLASMLHGPALVSFIGGGTLDAGAAARWGLVQAVVAEGASPAAALDAAAVAVDGREVSLSGAPFELAPAHEAAVLAVIGAASGLTAPTARLIEAREMARLAEHPQLVHQRRHWRPQAADSPWSAALAEQVERQYQFEGMALLGDAVPAERVEALASLGGLATGPLRGLDEAGLKSIDALLHARMDDHGHGHGHDHGHGHGHGHEHAHGHGHGHGHDHRDEHDHHDHARETDWMPASAVYVMEKMAHGLHRDGKPTGGFYDWPADGEARLWSGLATFARGRPKATPAQAAERLLLISAIQTLRVLAHEPAVRSASWDAARPPGLSFPGWAGGPLGWIEWIGRDAFARRCEALADQFGERYQLPANWTELMPAQA